ncbi:hypothetical protein CO155_01810, partial [Candidatus Pacearchaeota archaeon CG_4_9_14_3_um_filter_35_19]
MAKKKVTLSIDSKVYKAFQKYCKDNATIFSKKIELVMKEILSKGGKMVIVLFIFMFLVSAVSAVQIAADDFECGANNCGSGWDGAWAFSGGCKITGLGGSIGNYHMRGDSACVATRGFDSSGYSFVNLSFFATAQSLESDEYCY